MTSATEWSGAVGDVWADEWRRTDRAFTGLNAALSRAILAAAPAGRFRALDIGCGAGATSLALATSRPDAAILGVDISAALIGVARDRAAEVTNLSFDAGDVVDLAPARGPFDLLFSRHGVMFFADRMTAFRALRAAAIPGGTLVFSCFADPDLNDFAGPLAAALGLSPPFVGDGPGPFAFADPQVATDLLSDTGWRLTGLDQIAFDYRVGAGPDALDDAVGFLSRIGPAAAAMRNGDGQRRAALTAGLRRYLAGFLRENSVDLMASAWLFSARA